MHIRKLSVALTMAAALLSPPLARADVVTEWNLVAVNASAATNSLVESRVLAIVHASMFDAANAIERRYAHYLAEFKPPAGASMDAAVAAAAHDVLGWLFPSQMPMLDGALAATLGRIADGVSKDGGLAFGREVAQAYVAARGKDGADGRAQHSSAPGPGQWEPTPPARAPMALPHWGEVTPFTAPSLAWLEVKGPPPITNEAFARDLDEVRRVGARNSTERTADQTAAAIFWIINTGVPWQFAARAAAQQLGPSVVDNARIFALMNMAGADAYIASWGIKRKVNHWRPVTAIRNASTNPDPAWEPLLNTPAHPEYPSGHCIYTGAAAAALQLLFNTDQVAFSATYGGPNGVIRTWRSFSQMEKEVENARVWGGIHFRTADEHGTQMGRAIAERAVATLMRPIAR